MKLTNEELDEILDIGGLELAQSYAEDEKYRKDGYLFTRCKACGTEAHYRLKYILHKNKIEEQVCRNCYWLKWYEDEPDYSLFAGIIPGISERNSLSIAEAETMAKELGFELIDVRRGSKPGDDVLVVKCLYCQRQTVGRPGDISAGCSCKGRWTEQTNQQVSQSIAQQSDHESLPRAEKGYPVTQNQKMSAREFKPDDYLAFSNDLSWWNFNLNDNKKLFKLTPRSKAIVNAYCKECGMPFNAPVNALLDKRTHEYIGICDECVERIHAQYEEEVDRLSITPVSRIEELLKHWADDHDPRDVMIFTYRTYIWECDFGHHPNQTPYSFYKDGCSVCKGLSTKKRNMLLNEGEHIPLNVPFELRDQWHPTKNKKFEFGKTSLGEGRKIWWQCDHCGYEWQESLRDRLRQKSYGAWDCPHKPYYRCPKCVGTLDSLGWHYPSLAKEWSERNPVSAWDVSPTSTVIDFTPEWVCSENPDHVWTMPLASRVAGAGCPQCRDSGKSKIELLYYKKAQERWSDKFAIKSGAILRDEGFSRSWQADILMVGFSNIVLEYDGAYWHKGKEPTDARKTNELLNAGYVVLRLREEGLSLLNIEHPGYFELTVNNKGTDIDFILNSIDTLLGLDIAESNLLSEPINQAMLN